MEEPPCIETNFEMLFRAFHSKRPPPPPWLAAFAVVLIFTLSIIAVTGAAEEPRTRPRREQDEKNVIPSDTTIQLVARRAARSEAWRAMARIRELMEDPDLYYDEGGDGPPRWIWSAESSVPRNVLFAEGRPPRLHVVVVVDDVVGMLEGFGGLVRHYKGLGMEGAGLVFDIRRRLDDDRDEEGAEAAYVALTRRIEAVGAEYSTTYFGGADDEKGGMYVSLLGAMRGLPLNDWVFMVHQTDRVGAPGWEGKRTRDGKRTRTRTSKAAAMWEFLDECERDGINSVWGEQQGGSEKARTTAKLVAVRGYLRPDPDMRRALSLSDAEALFDGSYPGSYVPYYRFWELYKSASVVGNAFLWSPRGSSDEPRLAL